MTSDTLRQQLEELLISYSGAKHGEIHVNDECLDDLMALVSKAVENARLDELNSIDNPVNVNLYRYGLMSVKDRIAEFTHKQEETV